MTERERRMWWDDDYDPKLDGEDLIVPSTLTPGGDCLGDGQHEGYECCCDECDYLQVCIEKAPQ